MTWTTRIVLRFVLVGEIAWLFSFALVNTLPFSLTRSEAYHVWFERIAVLAYLFRSDVLFWCLLALPPLSVAGYAYSHLMRTRYLIATRNAWVRAAAGATIALIVWFAFDVLAHWRHLYWCHECSVVQHFPPARVLNFVSRFLIAFGPIVTVVGALCGLAASKESWDEYVKQRGLEVGQLR
jgi:hypothetical protein